ncbi:MAG: dihydroorotase [Defluviitaleaceae bacterium]|nr:dihydroorotase [Defluviitaleaceae bacterium]
MRDNRQLLITGGRVIDPRSGTDEARDIFVADGVIRPVFADTPDCRVFDASGMIIVPGLVDLHVHFREPGAEYKEDIESGSRAAARGGYTTVCCMPNTKPAIDSREIVELVAGRGRKNGLVNLLVVGALSKGQEGRELADFEGMLRGGVCALSDDGKTLMDYDLMRQAATRAKELGLLITDHAENHVKSVGGVINDGDVSRSLGVYGIPSSAEADIVARDIELARETGCRIHLQHISAKESVALICEAKRRGIPITAETAPHYFTLTDEAVLVHGANAKMNPPLRTESDKQAIIEALRDGTIDVIATDHAPHSVEEKSRPLEQAPFGVVGLETAFAVSYTALVAPGHITLPELVRLMSFNPANILNLESGGLAVRDTANFAVFDIGNPYGIDCGRFVSKGRNTPFNGMKVYGRTALTVCSGKISWEDGNDRSFN